MNLTATRKNNGIALIVVLLAIAGLTVLAAGFAFSMKIETRLAMKADSEQQMQWLGRSGVETARWVLAEEMRAGYQGYDSLNQIWAGGPGSGAETNSDLSGFSLQNITMSEGSGDEQVIGTYSIKIVDLERKMNINTAPPMLIQQALTVMGVNANSINTVADSIEDWVQPGDEPRPAGAKSDYYQGLSTPYYAKDAPMDDISELLLVKGVTREMYWGPEAENHNPGTFQHKLGFGSAPGEEPNYPFGLKDVFTPISAGRININTADINLQIIPGVDANVAADIIKFRAGPDGQDGTADDMPYRSVGQLQQAGVNPQLMGQLGQICDVRSHTFEVHIAAQIGNIQREYVALLLRNSATDIQVVGFWWK